MSNLPTITMKGRLEPLEYRTYGNGKQMALGLLREDSGQAFQLAAFGDVIRSMEDAIGQSVEVDVQLRSKEHNGRYFTNLSCLGVRLMYPRPSTQQAPQPAPQQGNPPPPQGQDPQYDETPF